MKEKVALYIGPSPWNEIMIETPRVTFVVVPALLQAGLWSFSFRDSLMTDSAALPIYTLVDVEPPLGLKLVPDEGRQ